MKKKNIIILVIAITIIIGIAWFIVDYNQQIDQAQKEAAEFADKMKYPWRYREIKTNDDLMQVNMLIYNSDLSDEEKNKEASAAFSKYNNNTK